MRSPRFAIVVPGHRRRPSRASYRHVSYSQKSAPAPANDIALSGTEAVAAVRELGRDVRDVRNVCEQATTLTRTWGSEMVTVSVM